MEKSKVSRRQVMIWSIASASTLVLAKVARAQTDVACANGGDLEAVISRNHGHTFPITLADLEASVPVAIDLTGQSSHPHTLNLTRTDLDELFEKGFLTKVSSTDAGHSHQVTLTLAESCLS